MANVNKKKMSNSGIYLNVNLNVIKDASYKKISIINRLK